MSLSKQVSSGRTILLAAIILPVIGYLGYFAYQKKSEAPARTEACQSQCREAGYDGYDFKWGVVGGPQCQCLSS